MPLTIAAVTRVWGPAELITLGEACAVGDFVYHKGSTNSWFKAINTSLEASKARALLLAGGSAGAAVLAQTGGVAAIGTGAVGVTYHVSGTAGKVDAAGGTGTYTCLVGFGIGNNQIRLKFFSPGVAQA
jgi:hypothetical protein